MGVIMYNNKVYSGGGGGSISELDDVELTNLSDGEILKYDATEEKWVNSEDGGSSGESVLVPTPFIYSETEEQVGIWVDGKPLYQKTYVVTNVTAQTTILDTITNIDRLVNYSGTYTRVLDGVRTLYEIDGRTESSSYNNYGWTWGIANDGTIRLTFYGYTVSEIDSIAATIQYTKTTDTAWQGGFKAYGFTPVIYSMDEREIGVWKNGKPLYQKTFEFTVPSGGSGGSWTFGASIPTLEEVVHSEYTVDGHGECGYTSSAISAMSFVMQNKNFVEFWFGGSGYANAKIYYTCFYTKTTDVAGSGRYAELGVPAEHYDDTEHVIGTYFGKTLYQKTIYHAGGVSGTVEINHGITNLEKIIDYSGFVTDVSGIPFPFPRIAYDNNNVGMMYVTSTQVGMNNPSAFGTRLVDWNVTIKYTKSSS